MKISIDRGILLKALNHVQSVVERRNTIPILSNVKIDANEKNISLIATDLDLEIIEFIDANVIGWSEKNTRIAAADIIWSNFSITRFITCVF